MEIPEILPSVALQEASITATLVLLMAKVPGQDCPKHSIIGKAMQRIAIKSLKAIFLKKKTQQIFTKKKSFVLVQIRRQEDGFGCRYI
jgi:hypothetical protein